MFCFLTSRWHKISLGDDWILIFEGRKGAAISWKKIIARYYEKCKVFDVFEASKYRKTGVIQKFMVNMGVK